MKKRTGIKRQILFTKYLKEEESECKRMCHEAKRQFEESIRLAHYSFNVHDSALDPQSVNKNSENSKQKTNKSTVEESEDCEHSDDDRPKLKNTIHPDWVKPVFRKVVMVTHPDKLPEKLSEQIREKMIDVYRDSKIALESSEYVDLVILADDIDVSLPESKILESKIFDKKNSELNSSIKNLKTSIYWVWANSTDEEKEKILKDFIDQRGWTSHENKRKRSRKSPGTHPGKSISQMKKSKILKK
tara:strand:- start:730 stop:1464 length:735 start_codon:yes stop_codon:yes gene_type:complete